MVSVGGAHPAVGNTEPRREYRRQGAEPRACDHARRDRCKHQPGRPASDHGPRTRAAAMVATPAANRPSAEPKRGFT